MKFLRNLLAAILGTLIAFGILFAMFLIFLALVGNADDTVAIKRGSVLEITLNRPIYDYEGQDEADPFRGLFEVGAGLDEILHAIAVAKNDENIRKGEFCVFLYNVFAAAGDSVIFAPLSP